MSDRDEDKCVECDAPLTLHEEKRAGVCIGCASDDPMDADAGLWAWDDVEDGQDFLVGKTCNPNAPEECESCQ